MTWPEIEAQWSDLAPQARAKWEKLSDADLAHVGGDRARLIGKLEERYGLSAKDGAMHVDHWGDREARRVRAQ
jgi:uncharacterized protein YjbJ (UPF0337 family)